MKPLNEKKHPFVVSIEEGLKGKNSQWLSEKTKIILQYKNVKGILQSGYQLKPSEGKRHKNSENMEILLTAQQFFLTLELKFSLSQDIAFQATKMK